MQIRIRIRLLIKVMGIDNHWPKIHKGFTVSLHFYWMSLYCEPPQLWLFRLMLIQIRLSLNDADPDLQH
jgi:hypothetical protein